jgi:hypothetical protein
MMSITDEEFLSDYLQIRNGDQWISMSSGERMTLLNKIDELQQRVQNKNNVNTSAIFNISGNVTNITVG